ncbi:MAG: hypothetical protein J6J16_02160 [Lachnospiraceae bacterium]|nr:hypothetical protein [Lachnospiraceae bacterium]
MKYNTQVMNSIKDLNQACDELEIALAKMKLQKTAFYHKVSNGTATHNTIYNELCTECKRIEKYLQDVELIRDTLKSIDKIIKDADNGAYKKLVGPWYKQLGRKVNDLKKKIKASLEYGSNIVKEFYEKWPLGKYVVELLGDVASLGYEITGGILENFSKYGVAGFFLSGYEIINGVFATGSDLFAVSAIFGSEIGYHTGLVDKSIRDSFVEGAVEIGDNNGITDVLEDEKGFAKNFAVITGGLDTIVDAEGAIDSTKDLFNLKSSKDTKKLNKIYKKLDTDQYIKPLKNIKTATGVYGKAVNGDLDLNEEVAKKTKIGAVIYDYKDAYETAYDNAERINITIEDSTPKNYCVEPKQFPNKDVFNGNNIFQQRPAYRIN